VLDKLKEFDPEAIVLNYDDALNRVFYNDSSLQRDCFVFAGFVPPGKHCVVIKDQDSYLYKNLLIEGREAPVIEPALRKVQGQFKHEINIFVDWKLDTQFK
jgi:hypothetical protein